MSMVAQTQSQWFAKLQGWVPSWMFTTPLHTAALFQGLARMLADVDQSADDHVRQTSIMNSDTEFLDLHGFERGYKRLPKEVNPLYAKRVQSLLNASNPVALAALLNIFLIDGVATISEPGNGDIPVFNQSFFNRREIFSVDDYDTFTVIVDHQVHEGYSYLSRRYFANRGDFLSSDVSPQSVFDLIQEVIDTNKAAGTLYRVLERN